MGLLGTFIGLLATLNDIALLIGSFADLDMSTANPLDVFRGMIERMKAPMASMGIAFSASLFGLLGSIILGLMMVSLRRFQGDILSLLGSEVAQHIEFALAHGGFTYSKGALKLGLDKLGVPEDAPHHILVRPTRPIDLTTGEAQQAEEFGTVPSVFPAGQSEFSGVGAPGQEFAAAGVPAGQARVATPELDSTAMDAQVRVLLRIEERLAESARNELRALDGALDDFQKQRSDMLRTLAEQTESSNNFRGELQRVGRQLGSIMTMMEKSNTHLSDQLSELTIRLSGDFTESHRIMLAQMDEQRKLSEKLQKE
jgi:hypothetical protein